MPFSFPNTCPSREVPVPKGTMGMEFSLQIFTIFETSSVVSGKAMPKGRIGSKMSSPLA